MDQPRFGIHGHELQHDLPGAMGRRQLGFAALPIASDAMTLCSREVLDEQGGVASRGSGGNGQCQERREEFALEGNRV